MPDQPSPVRELLAVAEAVGADHGPAHTVRDRPGHVVIKVVAHEQQLAGLALRRGDREAVEERIGLGDPHGSDKSATVNSSSSPASCNAGHLVSCANVLLARIRRIPIA